MAKTIQFQDPGEGIHDGEVVEIHVSPGDELEKGQVVLVVETDKAAFEVESPLAGKVDEVRVAVGDTIEVGQVIATLAASADAPGAEREAPERDSGQGEAPEREASEPEDPSPKRAAPEGRVTPERQDAGGEEVPVRAEQEAERRESREPAPRAGGAENGAPVPASPATRRLARDLGVDLRAVEPSGEEGRVLAGDVRAHASGSRGGGARRAEAPTQSDLPDFSRFGPTERAPLRSVRRTTARRMAEAWRTIPHVTHEDEADITELEALRRRQAEEAEAPITLSAVVVKAAAAVLREFPRFNASLDMEAEEIVYKDYRHIGVAVDTDRGLLVPVVRDVDGKSVRELGEELAGLAERARQGDLRRDDLAGGSFTVTNPGAIGGRHLAPIINPPQVAILGLARARWEPRVRGTPDGEPPTSPGPVEVRLVLPLCLTFDHRVNDGADAARFTNRIVAMLSDPECLAVSV